MPLKRLSLTIMLLLNLLGVGFAQEPTLLEHGGGVRTVVFSPVDASLVASAGESHIIKLWNLQNDTVKTLRGHTGIVNSVAFSPNGELLASVSDDRTIKLWNVHNQQNISTLQGGTHYRSVAFSPDGQLLATGGGMHVKLWDVRRRVVIGTLQHNQGVRPVAFSHDGQLLAAGDGSGDGPGTVKVYDIQKRQVVVNLNANPKSVKAVEFSSDNRYLASTGWNGYLKIWDVSNWTELWTLPDIGHHDFAFSPDAKVIVARSGRGSVNLYWVEDGSNVAELSGLQGWRYFVDFSHDGTSLAVGAEDGIVRIWRIDTSPIDGREEGAVQILHIDTYLEQVPDVNSANRDNIPEPAPPPSIVRNFFQLDPFYEQWIDVKGLPVIASAKVNPYALKEAAWLILKMIGHRPDVLRAMVENSARFSVIAHTEIITEIPEYHSDPRPDFLVYRQRGWGAIEATISSSEENILSYPGGSYGGYNVLIHEFAHGIHLLGLYTSDPTFDERLQGSYEAAIKKGLWQGTYATSDRKEYWAEGTQAWFYPNGPGSFEHFGNTRQALKAYDPDLAALLTEIYGDGKWRYTPIETRTGLPHLQGFNPQNSPTFGRWPELEALYQQLRNPNSDGGGEWVNLKPHNPDKLSSLTESNVLRNTPIAVVFVNLSKVDVLLYSVHSDGTERFRKRVRAGKIRETATKINQVWLVKNANGKNIVVFQAAEKTGRATIGIARKNVDGGGAPPQALVPQFQRPPMYWVDADAGTLHRLVGESVDPLMPNVRNATGLAVDTTNNKLYWTEKTGTRTGKIRSANLDGTHVQLVKEITSVPHSIAVDTENEKLYWTNAWGKVQRINADGTLFKGDFITGLEAPKHITLDVAGGKLYWTESTNHIRRANLDGSNIETLATDVGTLGGIAIADDKLYWTEQTGESTGSVQSANLDGTDVQTLTALQSVPLGITVDSTRRKLYWTSSRGTIQRANLNGNPNVQVLVVGLNGPTGIVLDTTQDEVVIPEASVEKITGPWLWMIAPTQAGQGGARATDVDSLAVASGGTVTEAEIAANGARAGDIVGDYTWTLGEIATHGGDNVNHVINNIGIAQGDIDDHSAYALITLESATAQPGVAMRVGSDDSVKVWLNGEVVHNNPIDRGAGDFQDTFKVNLVPGDNLLLVKVSDRAEHWTLFVGIDADVKIKKPVAAAPLRSPSDRVSPTETVLLSNYPNPFNPETWIPYQLSKPADVTVSIYAVDGKLIRALALGHQAAGFYDSRAQAAYWDGRNALGESVASGVYFYTLSAGDFTATRKMLIRK